MSVPVSSNPIASQPRYHSPCCISAAYCSTAFFRTLRLQLLACNKSLASCGPIHCRLRSTCSRLCSFVCTDDTVDNVDCCSSCHQCCQRHQSKQRFSFLALWPVLGFGLDALGPGADLGHGLYVAGGLWHTPLAQNLRPVHADTRRSNIPDFTQNSDFNRPLLRGFSA